MHMLHRPAIPALLGLSLLGGCSQQQATSSTASTAGQVGTTQPASVIPPVARDAELARLATLMSGSFSSGEQAQQDPDFFHIVLHMSPIWRDRTDGVWLYVEQAVAQAANKPYRQRVYRLTHQADGTFKSDVYTLPGDPLQYAGAWNDPARLSAVKPEALTLRDGCSISLRAQTDGTFTGATNGTGCASDLRGASYATSEANITPAGLIT